jgi:hypothetical protein
VEVVAKGKPYIMIGLAEKTAEHNKRVEVEAKGKP